MVKKGWAFVFFVACFLFFTPVTFAASQDYPFTALFLDAKGDPITTPLDLRLSLWDSYDVRPGDIDENGNINESALHYGGYQTSFSVINDKQGYFDEQFTLGQYIFHTIFIEDFPEIGTTNYFVQVEYKHEGERNTAYQIYDFIDDPPFDNMQRLSLREGTSYITSDAGSKTNNNTFTLDSNSNAPTAVTLQFGEILAKTLAYSIENARFELNDHLLIDGGLTVTDGHYLQFQDFNAGAPPVEDCDADAERGRLSLDTSNHRLYICDGASRGWDYANLND